MCIAVPVRSRKLQLHLSFNFIRECTAELGEAFNMKGGCMKDNIALNCPLASECYSTVMLLFYFMHAWVLLPPHL